LTGGGKEGLPPEFSVNHNYFTNLKVGIFIARDYQIIAILIRS
jgi:hypothetical protein